MLEKGRVITALISLLYKSFSARSIFALCSVFLGLESRGMLT